MPVAVQKTDLKTEINDTDKQIHHIHLSHTIRNYLRDQEVKENIVWVWPSYGMTGAVPKKCRKIDLSLAEIQDASAHLFDDAPMLALFTEEGKAKTRRVNTMHEDLNNIGNLVSSAFRSGKVGNRADLEKRQAEAIHQMKLRVMQENLQGMCIQDEASISLNAKMKTLNILIDDASGKRKAFSKNTASLPAKGNSVAAIFVQDAVKNCMNDMTLVEEWAHGVWKKHGVMMEPVAA